MRTWFSEPTDPMEAREFDMETFPFRYIRRTAWFEVLSNVKRARSILSVIPANSVGWIDDWPVFARGCTNASRSRLRAVIHVL